MPCRSMTIPYSRLRLGALALALLGMSLPTHAQTCQSASDLEPEQRSTIEAIAKHYFDMVAAGDSAGLQKASIPAVATNFAGIEASVKDNQPVFSQAQVSVRSVYALTAEGSEPLSRAEFLCGVFGANGQTTNSVVFVLQNLPPGKYAVAILDAKASQDARTLTLVLQQSAAEWKLAGFYARITQINGHDSAWFAQRAREFKAKGQNRNAWFYFHEAIALAAPADFVSTLVTDKLYDEVQSVPPADLPVGGGTLDLSAAGAARKVTAMFAVAVGNDFDLVVKYDAADISDTYHTFQTNVAVIKAVVARFPEFRDGFDGVVARAVEPSGRDYGAMLPMKEIK